jgi:hypothetical protein
VAENSPNGAGRQPRAPGAQQINAGEMLAELVRLVDSSGLAPERPPPPVEPATQQKLPDGEMAQPLEMELPRLSPSAPSTDPKETVVVAVEPPEPRKSSNSNSPNRIGSASRRGSGAWTLRISTLVLVGAVGSIVWLELMKSKPPEAPPVIAEAQSLPAVQPRSIATVAASSDAAAIAPRDIARPAEINAASLEERTNDPDAHAALENPPPSQDAQSAAIGSAQPTDPIAATPSAAPVNTVAPAPAEPLAASPPAAAQSLDSEAAPAVSLPPEPTPAATPAVAAKDSGVAALPSKTPLPPARPAPKAAIQAGAVTQRSTPKPDFSTKLSSQSGAHAIAKASATGPGTPEAKTPLKPAQAAVEPQATPFAQPAPAPQQPNPNLVARAFGTVAGAVGAVAGLIPFVGH